MSALAESLATGNGKETVHMPHYEGEILPFEGINIQLDKGQWVFGEGKNTHRIDTYSIWNPAHHEEIAERLKTGTRAAAYIMGNFGVVEVRRPGDEKEEDAMFDKIKKRARSQNFVAFVNPDDIRDLIDISRLPSELKQLRWAGNRHDVYPGPLHAVFPIKKNAEVDPGVIRRQDQTLAAFWIPGHWGYEQLGDKLRKKVKLGLLGGGSLNIHGGKPSYTTKELFTAFTQYPEWQEEIDMIIFDEIAEAANIGRSQTMLSFAEFPPRMIRVGSMSPEAIEMHLGMPVQFDAEKMADPNDTKYRASSVNNIYDNKTNKEIDNRVQVALEQMARYKEYYEGRLKGESVIPLFRPRRTPRQAV